MKICVYAIAKNEEKFAARWAVNMSEADEITVLDTGSNDKTVEILSAFPKVKVYKEKILPWRFDNARNRSLELVNADADYCVCTDLDEIFNKGWRKKLEQALISRPDKISYEYIWSFDKNGRPETIFNAEKIHKRHGFCWCHPVHEVLVCKEMRRLETVFAQGVVLKHYPDSTKSRGQYLPLLELSVKENPENDRNMHYLGREYMFYSRFDEAIKVLKKHLSLPSAVWKDERCASMRYIARCLIATGKEKEAFVWYLKACAEAPYLREPWMETAEYLYSQKNWHGVITFINEALGITSFSNTYISDISCRGEKPYDLLSIACYYTGNTAEAIKNCEKALEYSPDNGRIKANLQFFRASIQ